MSGEIVGNTDLLVRFTVRMGSRVEDDNLEKIVEPAINNIPLS